MATPHPGPIPPLPSQVTIPNIKVTSKTTGTLKIPASPGFFYAGIQSLWVWWSVELPLLRSYLEPLASATCGNSTLRATRRPCFTSCAKNTTAVPPRPSSRSNV